jgi:hypothetical protein
MDGETYHLIISHSVIPSPISARLKVFAVLDLETVVFKPRRVKGIVRRWGLGSDEKQRAFIEDAVPDRPSRDLAVEASETVAVERRTHPAGTLIRMPGEAMAKSMP